MEKRGKTNKRNSVIKGLSLAAIITATFIYTGCNRDDDSTPAPNRSQTAGVAGTGSMNFNQNDTVFIKNLAMGNNAEIALGKLAAQKGMSEDVKQFGQKMVTDHGQAGTQLRQIANVHGYILPPDSAMDAEHMALKNQLQSLSGYQFDSVYINSQIKDHIKTLELLQYESRNGSATDVVTLSQQLQPTVQNHLDLAKAIGSRNGYGSNFGTGTVSSTTNGTTAGTTNGTTTAGTTNGTTTGSTSGTTTGSTSGTTSGSTSGTMTSGSATTTSGTTTSATTTGSTSGNTTFNTSATTSGTTSGATTFTSTTTGTTTAITSGTTSGSASSSTAGSTGGSTTGTGTATTTY